MESNRAHDFMMLFVHGDVVVLPAQHLDVLLDRMMAGQSEDDFMKGKGFVLDETAMPSIPMPLTDAVEAPVASVKRATR